MVSLFTSRLGRLFDPVGSVRFGRFLYVTGGKFLEY